MKRASIVLLIASSLWTAFVVAGWQDVDEPSDSLESLVFLTDGHTFGFVPESMATPRVPPTVRTRLSGKDLWRGPPVAGVTTFTRRWFVALPGLPPQLAIGPLATRTSVSAQAMIKTKNPDRTIGFYSDAEMQTGRPVKEHPTASERRAILVAFADAVREFRPHLEGENVLRAGKTEHLQPHVLGYALVAITLGLWTTAACTSAGALKKKNTSLQQSAKLDRSHPTN